MSTCLILIFVNQQYLRVFFWRSKNTYCMTLFARTYLIKYASEKFCKLLHGNKYSSGTQLPYRGPYSEECS
ncbi:hypothetical protein FKM82_006999 [Ascaphus truei]